MGGNSAVADEVRSMMAELQRWATVSAQDDEQGGVAGTESGGDTSMRSTEGAGMDEVAISQGGSADGGWRQTVPSVSGGHSSAPAVAKAAQSDQPGSSRAPREEGKPTGLPPGWRTAKDESGGWYYYHKVSRVPQWEPPPRPSSR